MTGDPKRPSQFADFCRRILAGEPGVFEAWVETYTEPFMRDLLLRFGASIETAEDLTQETFTTIVEELKKHAAKGGIVSDKITRWGYTILENKFKKHRKEKKRLPTLSMDELKEEGQEFEEPSTEPSLALLEAADKRRIAKVMEDLFWQDFENTRGKTREYLELLRKGLSVEEIARVTGANPHTCRSLIDKKMEGLTHRAHVRAIGFELPPPGEVTRVLLEATLDRLKLPRHARDIARLACLDHCEPEEIARRLGYRIELVVTNLDVLWRALTIRFRRDFPEALEAIG